MNNAVSERRLAMIDMGNDRKIANMVLLHQYVQRWARLKKRRRQAPCLIIRKAAILADFAQIITDFGHIDEVMAEFQIATQQDRNAFAKTRFHRRVGIGINQVKVDAKFLGDRPHSLLHVVTQVAVHATDQRQRKHGSSTLALGRQTFDGNEGLRIAATHQQGNVGRPIKLA